MNDDVDTRDGAGMSDEATTEDRTGRDATGIRRVAHRVLRFAVRGRGARGGPWGEAVLAEFDQAAGTGAALRWSAGGLRVAVRERVAALRAVHWAAVAAVVVFAGSPLLVTVAYIPSGGMSPTLEITSRHLIDRVAFRVTGIKHGDIVAFPIPDSPAHNSLRRVIGLAGDRIDCRDGRVFRDGTAIDEPYLPISAGTVCAPVTVPDGAIYVLGDKREVAQDSRHWGLISEETVTGRVLV